LRTLLAALALAALVTTLLPPADTTATSRACSGGVVNNKRVTARDRLITDTSNIAYDTARSHGAYTAVSAQAYVRDLEPCTGTSGLSFVLPANMENVISGATVGMVQLGYWERSGAARQFAWTPVDDDSNGCAQPGCMVAVTWAETPQLGHLYQFSIYPSSSYWTFRIDDATDGQSWSESYVATWSQGERVWYGYEGKNDFDNLGVWGNTAPQVSMRRMERTYVDGAVYYVSDQQNCIKIGYPPTPYQFQCAFPTVTWNRDTLNVYTTTTGGSAPEQ
jgi:hypothetical protein